MDEITKEALMAVAVQNPGSPVHFTHQFLDGTDGNACGYVPNTLSAPPVTVSGQWWRG